jgi:hypothetical protein
LGHDDGVHGGRCGRRRHISRRGRGRHVGRRGRPGSRRCRRRRHRAGLRVLRRGGRNYMRFRLSSTTGEKTKGAATGEDWCKQPDRVSGGRR